MMSATGFMRSPLRPAIALPRRLGGGWKIADAIHYVVTRPRRVAVNEMLIRPTEQEA